ncbi:MAG: SDR family oxidoreductase [Terriglobia bacterium]
MNSPFCGMTARAPGALLTEAIFREHEIFLTGANGFLGKVILGLLVDRYPNLKHLHILVRPRGELSAAQRFAQEVLQSPALSGIAAAKGAEFLGRRITIWAGDIGAPLCGLNAEDRGRLAGRVGLILNCAGRVDFFPPLDDSFSANVDGVSNVVELAQRLGVPLLHVSTAFVCGETDGLVEETEPMQNFYPHRRGPEDRRFDHAEEIRHAREVIRQIYESEDASGAPGGHRSRELARRLTALGRQRAGGWGWVNTYTYSKSLGEQIIASTPGLDYAIVRPAIVESAWRFPFPGWIEGGRTAAPLVLMALGGLKDWPVREDAPLEIVPVDMTAAAILAVAALLLQKRHRPVYQLGSADVNPCTLGAVVRLLDREARRRGAGDGNGARGPRWIDWIGGTHRRRKARFVSAQDAQARRLGMQTKIARAQHWLGVGQAALEKAGLPGERWLAGWAANLRKLDLQAKFREQTLEQYLPFVLQNRYVFESENIRAGYAVLSASDRELLPWHPEQIDWERYWIAHQIAGIEKWVQPEAVREWAFSI